MKTFILLAPVVGQTLETEDVLHLMHFVGIMNTDTTATDHDVPGVVIYGTLTDVQKEALKTEMSRDNDKCIATFFIEYEDKDEDNFTSTLIHKPKNNERE